MMTSSDGTSDVTMMKLSPVANGVLKVETNDPVYGGCESRMEEHGMVVNIVCICQDTGKPKLLSTITFIDNLHRVRTTQVFTPSGGLFSVTAVQEQRVIDSVSGAMTRAAEKTTHSVGGRGWRTDSIPLSNLSI